jgi:hypothetical protein
MGGAVDIVYGPTALRRYRYSGWHADQQLGAAVAPLFDTNAGGRTDIAIGIPGWGFAANYPGAVLVLGNVEKRVATVYPTSRAGISLGAGTSPATIVLEPLPGEFDPTAIVPGTLSMRRIDDPVRQVWALDTPLVLADRNGNGVPDIAVSFSRTDLRELWGSAIGSDLSDSVRVDGGLGGGARVTARVLLHVTTAQTLTSATLSPNPVKDLGIITVYTSRIGPLRARLFDSRGRLVANLKEENAAAPGYHDIPLNFRRGGLSRASGTYYVKVETTDAIITRKVTLIR